MLVYYLLLPNKLGQDRVALKNRHLLSHHYWSGLTGWFWLWSFIRSHCYLQA